MADDKLTDRLRGRYKVGPQGLYGTRDFSGFIPPICAEAAERIEVLESKLDLIERKFKSANSVDVERITVRRNEWYTGS